MASDTRVYKRFTYSRLQRPGQYVDIQLARGSTGQAFGRIYERFLLRRLRRGPIAQLMAATPVFTGSMRDSVDIRRLSTVKPGFYGARTSYKAPYSVYNDSKSIFNRWTASGAVRNAAYGAVNDTHEEIRRLADAREARELRTNRPSRVRGRGSVRSNRRLPLFAIRILIRVVSGFGNYVGSLTR